MSEVKNSVRKAWKERKGPVVFTTVGIDGNPNNIYSTDVNLYEDERFVIANKYIDRSMKDRLPDSQGTLVFVTKDHRLYLVKGDIHYEYGGENYKFMKSWSEDRHPGHGAAVVNINEVYENGRKVV